MESSSCIYMLVYLYINMRTMIKEEEDLLGKKQGVKYGKGGREERGERKDIIYILDKQRKENIVVNKIDKHFWVGLNFSLRK